MYVNSYSETFSAGCTSVKSKIWVIYGKFSGNLPVIYGNGNIPNLTGNFRTLPTTMKSLKHSTGTKYYKAEHAENERLYRTKKKQQPKSHKFETGPYDIISLRFCLCDLCCTCTINAYILIKCILKQDKQRYYTGWSMKNVALLMSISSPIIDRFSNFFH